MAESKHLSHSQISLMLKCPRQYRYRYIERIKTPIGPQLILGTCYHSALERNFLSKVKDGQDVPVELVLEHYDNAWKDRVAREQVDWQGEDPGAVKDCGIGLVRCYMDQAAPFVMPAAVEKPFEINLPGLEGYTLKGVIDMITTNGVIVDHKTASKSKSQDEADSDLQPYAYAAKLFEDPTVETVQMEFHIAVKTKVPKVEIIRTVRTREGVEWYIGLVTEVAKQIRAGIFPPCDPTNWCCSPKWCGYYRVCMTHRGGD